DGHQAEKAPCKPSNAESGEKEPRKGSWVPSITWLFVLAVALIYRLVDERQISKRELPLPSDLFIVSYPKSGNFWVRFFLAHTWLYSQPGESNWHREIDFNSIERTIPDLEYGPNRRDYHLTTSSAPSKVTSRSPRKRLPVNAPTLWVPWTTTSARAPTAHLSGAGFCTSFEMGET
ncbi:unnamed protein product, partial [Ectocarpus sp. 8 AP-2014]